MIEYWKILGLVSNSPRLCSMFGFDPGTDVLGFCGEFWCPSGLVTNEQKNWFLTVKGPCGALFLWVRDWAILCVIA